MKQYYISFCCVAWEPGDRKGRSLGHTVPQTASVGHYAGLKPTFGHASVVAGLVPSRLHATIGRASVRSGGDAIFCTGSPGEAQGGRKVPHPAPHPLPPLRHTEKHAAWLVGAQLACALGLGGLAACNNLTLTLRKYPLDRFLLICYTGL